MEKCVKVVFLLPTKDNDGSDLLELIDEIETKIEIEVEKEWSNFVGYFRGKFKMKDKTYKMDLSQMYFVMFTNESEEELKKELEKLKKILYEFKSKTTQESIYFEVNRNQEFFLL